ncbi:hypothetical protein SAMN02745246_00157 [Leeuwenhoekiella marinoflava DSM 3653]|uniref:Lipoprotein n=2 Tax=Leeuwenhoekiella marinoflava TaxID=988 RepID=A0A4Q0PR35_9FLAO|nr:hypothetical protein DSL99_97 [Leeuwenhoekiella marinoflava]SHE35163.1 hypothetical protein SAMN02745246_00157 [Leeuwenhoekiella marinoflava DSM 3653]
MKYLMVIMALMLFSCRNQMNDCVENVMKSKGVSKSVAKEMCEESRNEGQIRR